MTVVRDGFFRSQGPFRHPILAGTFGATSLPLLIGLWAKSKNRTWWLALGIASTAVITITSASSGPALAYCFALIGLVSWAVRRHMRLIRWGIVFALISLHIVMKAPVWYLITRISDVIGGSGWHRAYLIDQAINHFNDWWLIGTRYTADWLPYTLTVTATDVTNEFIGEGIDGGLLRMALFISIIVVCFRTIGQSMRRLENPSYFSPFQMWCFGACLLAHVASFFSVSYFDQMIVFWWMLLAMISTFKVDSMQTRSA